MSPRTAIMTADAVPVARPRWRGSDRLRADYARLGALAVAAVVLRLLLFLGRGDYVAFDEGWYLLLGRNFVAGEGYQLSGLRHVTLSPLFPLLAGTLDLVIGNIVWAGRIIAAVGAGLLVLPCWFVFRRMVGRRTSWIACGLIAVMPSLAPFVAAYWVGFDLWVGAEPLLHLFLFAGIALGWRAVETGGPASAALAGGAFALAYLARAEAVLVAGLFLLAALALGRWHGRRIRAVGCAVAALSAFSIIAAPYWSYLHDATGQWTLTGRGVRVESVLRPGGATAATGGAAGAIERMLWRDDPSYASRLYALDATGTRLASGYWGVSAVGVPIAPAAGDLPVDAGVGGAVERTNAAANNPADEPIDHDTNVAGGEDRAPSASPDDPARLGPTGMPRRFALFVGAMRRIFPIYLWPLALLGLLAPGHRHWRQELLHGVPIVGSAALIAYAVAIDPRTQLLIVPVLALYAARGIRHAGIWIDGMLRGSEPGAGRRIGNRLIFAVVLLLLLGTDAGRLYLSVTAGSPHHVVGERNREIGGVLARVVPEGEPVMSYHPALALFATRDWRVLPDDELRAIVRYANATGCEYLVMSAYYPSPSLIEAVPGDYLILHVPPGVSAADRFRLELIDRAERYSVGILRGA